MTQKYRCVYKELKLCLTQTDAPTNFKVRVTQKPQNRPFNQSLVIAPGTTLCLCKGKHRKIYVTAKVFIPRIQYGKTVASGTLIVLEPIVR
jgi:hypothetical protein